MIAAHARRPAWFPTPEQELLLKAVHLSGPPAVEAWRQWSRRVDLPTLDPGSYALIPSLYRALIRQGIETPHLPLLKAHYQRTWFKNRDLFHVMSGIVSALSDRGIPTLVLKGVPLVLQYYRDYGVRAMGDFDLLIHRHDLPVVTDALTAVGFRALWGSHEAVADAQVHFKDAAGHELDVHWRVFSEDVPGGDDEFWAASVAVPLGAGATRTLHPSDLLLHVCGHATIWKPIPVIWWVSDVLAIARSAPAALDWERVSLQAGRRQLTLPLRESLRYLKDVFDAAIPEVALARLASASVPIPERVRHAARTRPPERWGLWLALGARYLDYRANRADARAGWRFGCGFLRYLRGRWTGTRWWALPFVAVGRGVRRVLWGAGVAGTRN